MNAIKLVFRDYPAGRAVLRIIVANGIAIVWAAAGAGSTNAELGLIFADHGAVLSDLQNGGVMPTTGAVQRMDCDAFAACAELDPEFAAALAHAADAGVEVLVYACDVGVQGVTVGRRMPWAR